MIIIGERLNTSRNAVLEAVKARDEKYLQDDAKKQVEAGASFVDVNAGLMLEKEAEALEWMVEVVQNAVDVTLAIDSSSTKAIERALKVHRGQAMVNSISLEAERYDSLIPLLAEHNCLVVGLCLDDRGIPESAKERLELARVLVDRLVKDKVEVGNIFLDPLATSLATDPNAARVTIETVEGIKNSFEGVRTTLGLSNVSYGLPCRRLFNRTFLSMLMTMGLDAPILDPLDKNMMGVLLAADALTGQDEFCMRFISATRSGMIEKE